jgi:uncharacterized protein involved in outer membrane biogenesis
MSGPETKPRRPLRKFLKILLLLVVLMIVIVALLPTIASTGMGRSWVESRLSTSLHREVALGEFDAGWGSGIAMANLTIKNPEGFSNEPLLQAKTIKLRPSITEALGGTVDADFELRDVSLRLERNAEGLLNTDGMFPAEEKPAEEKPEEKKEPAAMRVHLILENVSVTYLDHGKPEDQRETRVEDIDLDLRIDGTSPESLSGALRATVAKIATGSELGVENLTLEASGQGGKWALKQMRLPIGGGEVFAKADLDLASGGQVDGAVEVRNVRLTKGFPFLSYALPIFEVEAGGEAAGTLDAKITFRKGAGEGAGGFPDLSGSGEIRIANGAISGNAILAEAKALPASATTLKFDKLATRFAIGGGRVKTDPVTLGGGTVRLRLAGSVGFDGTLDYTLGLTPHGGQWGEVGKFLGEDGLLPIKVTGSITSPVVHEPSAENVADDLLKKGVERGIEEGLNNLLGR